MNGIARARSQTPIFEAASGLALVRVTQDSLGGRALVELRGIEPLTSAVRLQRSPI